MSSSANRFVWFVLRNYSCARGISRGHKTLALDQSLGSRKTFSRQPAT